MLREARTTDISALTAIYNEYVLHSTATFDTTPLSETQMQARIEAIAARYPVIVCEEDGEIAGFCYAHAWKERAAYARTLETTVYLAPKHTGRGLGRLLMEQLIGRCRHEGYRALIACITRGNLPSIRLHKRLGFRQVSLFEKVGIKCGRELDVTDFELLL